MRQTGRPERGSRRPPWAQHRAIRRMALTEARPLGGPSAAAHASEATAGPGERSSTSNRAIGLRSGNAAWEGTARLLKSLNNRRVVRTWTSRARFLSPAAPK
jgi:hypothetical protein